MSETLLKGVIAAIPTPVDSRLEPDTRRFVAAAEHLLATGCDALNVCGTTGEATSMSLPQRLAVMRAAARSLPRERLMVGTGAAALQDAIALTRCAGELGFAGALLLPPFYYKGVPAEGIVDTIRRVAEATADSGIPIYLYNFPQMTGIVYTAPIVEGIRAAIGDRLRGLKDSSGELDYARSIAAISDGIDVFPSDESVLPLVRKGAFAGCISATAAISGPLCARVLAGDEGAVFESMVKVRGTLAGGPLVPRVKACLARLMDDDGYALVLPPLRTLSPEARAALWQEVSGLLVTRATASRAPSGAAGRT
jgi:4-hydroxy-tetrahydrodipicolinate synthase